MPILSIQKMEEQAAKPGTFLCSMEGSSGEHWGKENGVKA